MLKFMLKRGIENGSRHGISEGLKRTFDTNSECMDNERAEGELGIVLALGAVLITLMLTSIILGLFSKSVSSNLSLPATFNASVAKIDTNAQSSYSLAAIVPIAVVGTGILAVVVGALSYR